MCKRITVSKSVDSSSRRYACWALTRSVSRFDIFSSDDMNAVRSSSRQLTVKGNELIMQLFGDMNEKFTKAFHLEGADHSAGLAIGI